MTQLVFILLWVLIDSVKIPAIHLTAKILSTKPLDVTKVVRPLLFHERDPNARIVALEGMNLF